MEPAMPTQLLNPPELYDASSFGMSQAVVDLGSGLVFVSGQVAWDVDAKVVGKTHAEQTKKALENLSVVLASAGASAADVVSVRVYMRGEIADHLEACVPALASYFGPARPALTGIGVASLATPDTLIEIEVVARVLTKAVTQ
jgi:2-iminobutanoate/2-iminopropanoate deaminase